MGLMVAVLSVFILALATPGLHRLMGRVTGWALAFLPLALTIYFASFLQVVASGETIHARQDWVSGLGVSLSFSLDGLSLLFTLLICGIGALVLVYAGGYLAGHPQLGRFYALLLMFMASMLGLVLADNLLVLFVFWELTSVSSYFLIGFDHERAESRAAALQALLVTSGGGLALLAGLLLLGQASGSLELSTLMSRGAQVRSHDLYAPCLLLILVGAFTKSAQFPFHFWLPSAMEAPTPVSAYLHSATMVKAGVYLLARMSPILGGTDIWGGTVTAVGIGTMLVGASLAIVQSDLKRILAYSTVSALGMLTFLLGLGGQLAIGAAMAFLLVHALYKGALFLVAGALDHETGTRDVALLGGLFRAMPVTALAAGLAALSMAGLPPLFGFIAKELIYEATLHAPAPEWLTVATFVVSAAFVAVAMLVGLGPFMGRIVPTPRQAHEAPPSLWLGALTLSGLGMVFGLAPQLGIETLVSTASVAVLGRPAEIPLALWHGLTPALALSVVTLAAGLGLYAARGMPRKAASWLERPAQWGPAGWYELGLKGLNGLAVAQTQLLQSGYLRYYLLIVLSVSVALVGGTLVASGNMVAPANWSDVRFYEAGLVLLILLATLATVLIRSRLAAIATLGVVGYGVALIFVLFGAPDLAMTQFLVETLTVILFVLVFSLLPEPQRLSSTLGRVRDVAVAAAVGVMMSALVLVAADAHYYPSISSYFSDHSLSQGHGRNIVNVILVDFRAMDTLGEITVLAVAGVGVYALLKLRPNIAGREDAALGEHGRMAFKQDFSQAEQLGEAQFPGEEADGEPDRSSRTTDVGKGENQ